WADRGHEFGLLRHASRTGLKALKAHRDADVLYRAGRPMPVPGRALVATHDGARLHLHHSPGLDPAAAQDLLGRWVSALSVPAEESEPKS
ncbi:hypothetical protein, partial [Crossiella equi]